MPIKTSVSSHQLKRLTAKFSDDVTIPANPKQKPKKQKAIQKSRKMSGNLQSLMAKASVNQKNSAKIAENNHQEWLAKKAEKTAKEKSDESK